MLNIRDEYEIGKIRLFDHFKTAIHEQSLRTRKKAARFAINVVRLNKDACWTRLGVDLC